MYQLHKCHYCKQWVIWNGHEDSCEEMPEACHLCYKLVRRKNLEVILDLCLHFLFIHFSSELVMKGHVLYVAHAWVFVRERKGAHCLRTRGCLNRPEDSSFRKMEYLLEQKSKCDCKSANEQVKLPSYTFRI